MLCSLTAVLTGLFLVSRLRAGAPWVGPDGDYDLESIAAVVVGGTALAGGRAASGARSPACSSWRCSTTSSTSSRSTRFLKDVLRGVIIVAAVAIYAPARPTGRPHDRRTSPRTHAGRRRARRMPARIVRGVREAGPIFLILLVLLVLIAS